MFEVASLAFDSVSGLRLAVAGLDNVQVIPVDCRVMILCLLDDY